MDESTVTIRGTKDGLVVSLGRAPLETILAEIETRLAARASFFRGGRVALRAGDRALSGEQLQAIGAKLQQLGVTLWAVESTHPATFVAAHELGLETSLSSSAPPGLAPASVPPAELTREDLTGIVVRKTLRAGQELHHTGHITLIGDVNPGAEVVAGGDVVVWGKLRGTVHAGAMGDGGAVVCALQLAPSQIRIATYIAQPPERSRLPKTPEMASVQEGAIVVERWDRG